MTVKFGRNGVQVEAFARVAAGLDLRVIPRLSNDTDDGALAAKSVFAVRHSGAVTMALASNEDRFTSHLRDRVKQDSSWNRVLELKVTPLVTCHQAFAARPLVSDDIIARVVDPFCEYTGFEWRSWGVSTEGDLGPEPASATPGKDV